MHSPSDIRELASPKSVSSLKAHVKAMHHGMMLANMADGPGQPSEHSLPSRDEVSQLIDLLRNLQSVPADIADMKRRLATVEGSLADIYRILGNKK